MTIHYQIQSFDNEQPPQLLKTFQIRNAVALPSINHVLNIDLEDYIVKEVRHRVAYKTETFTSESGIQSSYQEVDGIVVIAHKKADKATYSLK